jgi:thiol-disulfide isomerase/thioredoxin
MKKIPFYLTSKVLLILAFQLIAFAGLSQGLSFSDPNVTFKDAAGKVLSRDEAEALTKGPFGTRTEELPGGKKNVTIIPISEKDIAARAEAKANFVKSLLNNPIQPFEFVDLKGNKFTKEELAGKVIVFNFWFVACKPCVMEMPLLNELVEEFKGKNVVFLAPALDEGEQIQKFLEKTPFTYNIVPNAKGYANGLGVKGFPTHLIVDGSGVIKNVFMGYNDKIKNEVGDAIKKALATSK